MAKGSPAMLHEIENRIGGEQAGDADEDVPIPIRSPDAENDP